MLTAAAVLYIEEFKAKLPALSVEDSHYVIGHLVALETAGIPGDAAGEKRRLERLILQFGWHLAYFRYVDGLVAVKERPRTYNDWLDHQPTPTVTVKG